MKKLLCWFFKTALSHPRDPREKGQTGLRRVVWLLGAIILYYIGWWVLVSRFLLADEFGFLAFYWLISLGFSLSIGWWVLDSRFSLAGELWIIAFLGLLNYWISLSIGWWVAFSIRTGCSFWSNLFSLLIGQSQWIRIFSFLLSVECWVCWVMNILFSLVESNLKFKKSDPNPDQY